jgi:hypothetical protein
MNRILVIGLLCFTGAALADSAAPTPQIFAPGTISGIASEELHHRVLPQAEGRVVCT